jgi:5-methylcytosine-specific restriction protein A
MHDFQIGKIYNRARDIHTKFCGHLRSGIVTPSKHPIIFIFTGKGKRHGYEDKWSSDGTFRYFGEGQTGNMKLIKGNKAIANQIADGKDLLLFEILSRRLLRQTRSRRCSRVADCREASSDRSANMLLLERATWGQHGWRLPSARLAFTVQP